MQIPVHKLLQGELKFWVIGAGFEESGIYARSITGDDVFVF
jgi:hypothetical protein